MKTTRRRLFGLIMAAIPAAALASKATVAEAAPNLRPGAIVQARGPIVPVTAPPTWLINITKDGLHYPNGTVSDPDEYALTIRQQDTTNGRVFRIRLPAEPIGEPTQVKTPLRSVSGA